MTIIKKFEVVDQPKRKISKKIYIPLGICLTALIVMEIWINNMMISYSDKLQNISTLERALKMENQILENQVARYSSLYNLATESAKLGFSWGEKIQYIR